MSKYIVLLPLLLLTACSPRGPEPDDGRISVLVSVVPQEYFVKQIGGDLVDVSVLIPPGASPAAYELSPSAMRTVSGADVWFTIGLQRENAWIDDFSSINNNLRIVNTTSQITMLPIDRYSLPGRERDAGIESSGEADPHVWLSPELVRLQASVISKTLCDLDPQNTDVYTANLAHFMQEIDDLQTDIHELLDPHAGEGFMVFHPAWGYFADEFNLVQVPIEIAGSEPSTGELAELINYALEDSIKAVFVSPQFSQSSAATIAEELGAAVVAIDPLAPDWAMNLERVASELASAMN